MLNPENGFITCECRVIIDKKPYCMNICKKMPCRFRQPIEEEVDDKKQDNSREWKLEDTAS